MDINTIILIGFYLIILLYSVILHEVAHGVVALWLGDRTAQLAGRLTLHPKSHIDPFGSIVVPIGMLLISGFQFAFGWARPVPYNPNNLRNIKTDEVWVALAGPLSNFGIALIAAIIAKLLPLAQEVKMMIVSGVMSSQWSDLTYIIAGSGSAIVFVFCMIAIFWNVLLGVFNLLPVPPLDGSKLLYALFTVPRHIQIAMEQYGFFIVLAIVFLFPGPFHWILSTVWSLFFMLAL